MTSAKICSKTCTECALGPNSPFDAETKALVMKANEAGIIFNCHWPEKFARDTEDAVTRRMQNGGASMPLCHTSVEILKNRIRAEAFPPGLSISYQKMIDETPVVESHDAESMRALLKPGNAFSCTLSATLGFLNVPGKPIFIRRPGNEINERAD